MVSWLQGFKREHPGNAKGFSDSPFSQQLVIPKRQELFEISFQQKNFHV
jgi:hypothetical protein